VWQALGQPSDLIFQCCHLALALRDLVVPLGELAAQAGDLLVTRGELIE
jgi:hypothetical protein